MAGFDGFWVSENRVQMSQNFQHFGKELGFLSRLLIPGACRMAHQLHGQMEPGVLSGVSRGLPRPDLEASRGALEGARRREPESPEAWRANQLGNPSWLAPLSIPLAAFGTCPTPSRHGGSDLLHGGHLHQQPQVHWGHRNPSPWQPGCA